MRASRLDEPADIPKALEAAEKSIEQEDAPVEAWFNRALALESLHLVDAASKAWDDYLQRDSTSPWADEARKHLDELPPAQQSTLEEDRARARAALAEGASRRSTASPTNPRRSSATTSTTSCSPPGRTPTSTGHPSAAVLRTRPSRSARRLFRTTGDALPRDAALALSAPPSGPSRDPPRLRP